MGDRFSIVAQDLFLTSQSHCCRTFASPQYKLVTFDSRFEGASTTVVPFDHSHNITIWLISETGGVHRDRLGPGERTRSPPQQIYNHIQRNSKRVLQIHVNIKTSLPLLLTVSFRPISHRPWPPTPTRRSQPQSKAWTSDQRRLTRRILSRSRRHQPHRPLPTTIFQPKMANSNRNPH
jgi:hypothetical protein